MLNPTASPAEVKAMKARIRLTEKALKEALALFDLKAAHTASQNIQMYQNWLKAYSA